MTVTVRQITISELDVVRDLLNGGRHSRRTLAAMGISLPTADRWIRHIAAAIPGMRKVRRGKVLWLEWGPESGRAARRQALCTQVPARAGMSLFPTA